MIRWYDYGFAFLFADAMQALFFGVPIVGVGVAYVLYYAWINYYCDWRRGVENGQ
jgi:hypothetical protein